MMARDRRNGKSRQASIKTRAGIAAAVLIGGAAAVTAVVTTSHGPAAAQPAAFAARAGNEGNALSSALGDWGQSRQSAYAQLAQVTGARQFSQSTHHGKTLALQRGIVVLATKKFLILESSNGSLHLWLLSGGTQFQNVSTTTAGTRAMTASTSATQQAMTAGDMIPATTLMAGSPTTAAALLTPTATPQTVTVQVAGTDLTVTVTVTRSMAAVSQTATTPAVGTPRWSPTTFTQSAWQATNALARGDLALVAGTRSHWTLHAQLVLFTPLTTANVGGRAGNGVPVTAKPTAAATHW